MKGQGFFELTRHGLTVEEFNKGLFCMGIVFLRQREYVTVPAGTGCGHGTVGVSAGSYTRAPGSFDRELSYSSGPREYIMDEPDMCIEVIRVLQTEPLRLECIEYVSIEEGDEPVYRGPEAEWSYHPLGDGVCIDGYRGEAETVLVPAAIAGRPVIRLCLDKGSLTEDCRTLIISEGIAEVSLELVEARGLKRFYFPASARLIDSPRGLDSTRWFRRQGRNAVYLGGYYCGTPGGGSGWGEELVIAEGTVAVAYGADFHCYWRRIVMPDSVKSIDQLAFGDSKCLEELRLPAAVERIGDFAFQFCPRLMELYLPDSICHATAPFMLCTGLREVSIAASCPIKTKFSQCPRLIIRDGEQRRVVKKGIIPTPIPGSLHACPADGPICAAGRSYPDIDSIAACPGESGLPAEISAQLDGRLNAKESL